MKLIIGIVVLGVLLIALRVAVSVLNTRNIATGLQLDANGSLWLADCPDTPNCHSSVASQDDKKLPAFPVGATPGNAVENIATIVRSQPGATVVKQDERYLHAIVRTRLMGFIDDIEFLVDEDKTTLHVRSASRLGKYDFGANRKRVDTLRELYAQTQ